MLQLHGWQAGLVCRLLKMKNWGIFWPDMYTHGKSHKVQEKHFENRFWPVHPLGVALRSPLNEKGPPLPKWKVKIENHRIVPFDSSNEASWCTDCNAKNQSSFRWTVPEKMRLDRNKGPKKLDPNCSFSRFFSKLFMFIRCLKAYMKCLDPLSTIIEKLALFKYHIGENQEKL